MVLTIGFTGHRPNRLRVSAEVIERRIGEVLLLVAGRRPGRHIAISALAEGSDRMFARVGLAQGFALHALFPFKTADFATTFGDAAAVPEFDALRARASKIEELPGRLDEDGVAYERCGRLMVDRSLLLLAVWDGKPSAGRGGTPEIIEYARDKGVPVVWLNAVEDWPARVLSRAGRLEPGEATPLEQSTLHMII